MPLDLFNLVTRLAMTQKSLKKAQIGLKKFQIDFKFNFGEKTLSFKSYEFNYRSPYYHSVPWKFLSNLGILKKHFDKKESSSNYLYFKITFFLNS